jgi:hypothetical protein
MYFGIGCLKQPIQKYGLFFGANHLKQPEQKISIFCVGCLSQPAPKIVTWTEEKYHGRETPFAGLKTQPIVEASLSH